MSWELAGENRKLGNPGGITFDESGDFVYVFESDNLQVHKFNRSGVSIPFVLLAVGPTPTPVLPTRVYAPTSTPGDPTSTSGPTATPEPSTSCPPTLISPEEGALLDNGRVDRQDGIVWNFQWSNCLGSIWYHLNFGVGDIQTLYSTSYTYTNPGAYFIGQNRKWTWKVRAYLGSQLGWSEWSERTHVIEPLNTD